MAKIYNADLIGKKQSVVDEILLLNQHQTPLLNLLGFADAVTQTSHQWFEDEMINDETKVNGAVTNVATSVVVGEADELALDLFNDLEKGDAPELMHCFVKNIQNIPTIAQMLYLHGLKSRHTYSTPPSISISHSIPAVRA